MQHFVDFQAYSMTSLARPSSAIGRARPSAFGGLEIYDQIDLSLAQPVKERVSQYTVA
jgi:hypothetical protein